MVCHRACHNRAVKKILVDDVVVTTDVAGAFEIQDTRNNEYLHYHTIGPISGMTRNSNGAPSQVRYVTNGL